MAEDKVLTLENLATLTVNDLQSELKKRNLTVKGKKAELIERLKEALSKEQESVKPDTAKQSAPAKKETPSQTAPRAAQTQTQQPQPTPQASAKPSSKTASEKQTEEKDDEDVDIGGEEAKPTKQKEGKSGKEAGNLKGTTESVSDLEKRRQRADRFGTSFTATEDDKRSQRAQRFGVPSDEIKPQISDPSIARAKRFGLPVKEGASKTNHQFKGIAASQNRVLSAEEIEKRKKRAMRFTSSPVPEKKQKT